MFAESILRLKNGAKIYDLYIDNKNILWEIWLLSFELYAPVR